MTSSFYASLRGFCCTATLIFALGPVTGCGTEPSCGPGSRDVDGTCVAELRCGPGTVAAGDRCVVGDAGLDMSATRDAGVTPDATGGPDASGRPDVSFTCVPRCGERVCGDDGCGGNCGSCDDPSLPFCDARGQCQAECVPRCDGRECGDDGCGGTCGSCEGNHGCSSHGHCVPDGWTCAEETYDALDHCDCDCGLPDPDCDSQLFLPTVGCGAHDACYAGGCVPTIPAGWTCHATSYDDGTFCHCDCGVPDPDCIIPEAPVLGCQIGESCGAATGQCEACVPDCAGRACGGDGCGGSCGSCDDPNLPFCESQGQCLAQCTPDCAGRSCGDDGCGGSCGSCPAPEQCVDHTSCQAPPELSCASNCGASAISGCSCQAGCEIAGNCCVDYAELCTCQTDCSGKTCGDDGCGGSCGTCDDPGVPFCNSQGSCQTQCVPQCDGRSCGDDGCGGSCGTCAAGEGCSPQGQCVPSTWICPPHQYGDGTQCDCSCGAPDPDCATIGKTRGCPFDARCVASTGLCDVSYCSNEATCAGPAKCVGHYPIGDPVKRFGVCHTPLPGHPAGVPCANEQDCQTGLCVAGLCRQHCQQAGDCPSSQACIGVPLQDAGTGLPLGGVGVCDAGGHFGGPCTSQQACGPNAMCLLVFDPVTHAPTPRCGTPQGGRQLGSHCSVTSPCDLGLNCADNTCLMPCPGGVADCPTGYSCSPVVVHEGGLPQTSDDLTFDACVAP